MRILLVVLCVPVIVAAQAASQFRQVTFDNLGQPAPNATRYCVDCLPTAPCTKASLSTPSNEKGAYAVRTSASTWNCSIFAPSGSGDGDVSSNTSTSTVGQGVVFSS